jgi:hypothetical protein
VGASAPAPTLQTQNVNAPSAAEHPPKGTKPTNPGQTGHEPADSQNQNVDAPLTGRHPPKGTKPTKNGGSDTSSAPGVVGLGGFGGFSAADPRARVSDSGGAQSSAGDDVEFFQ